MMPAPRRCKAHSSVVNNNEVNPVTRRNTRRATRTRHREAMSDVSSVFSRIRNSIEDYLNGLYECIIYCDPGPKVKGGPLTRSESES